MEVKIMAKSKMVKSKADNLNSCFFIDRRKAVGERLALLRNSRGWIQKEVVYELDKLIGSTVDSRGMAFYKEDPQDKSKDYRTGTQTISDYERGKRNITLNMVLAYAKVFNVSLDYILLQTGVLQPCDASIAERTGLTEDSISSLNYLNAYGEEEERKAKCKQNEKGLLKQYFNFVISQYRFWLSVIIPLRDIRRKNEEYYNICARKNDDENNKLIENEESIKKHMQVIVGEFEKHLNEYIDRDRHAVYQIKRTEAANSGLGLYKGRENEMPFWLYEDIWKQSYPIR